MKTGSKIAINLSSKEVTQLFWEAWDPNMDNISEPRQLHCQQKRFLTLF
jgi:hypothetical protein